MNAPSSDPASHRPSKRELERRVADLSELVCKRLCDGQRIRRIIPDGRIYLDRLLPFLVLYRRPADRPDLGTEELATTEAAYFVTTRDHKARRNIVTLVESLERVAHERFGAYLVVELWSRPADHTPVVESQYGAAVPGFRVFGAPESGGTDAVIDSLARQLRGISVGGHKAVVEIPERASRFPHRPRPILGGKRPGTMHIGIEIEPCYVDAESGEVFPSVLKAVRAGMSRALRHGFFQFVGRQTSQRPANFHSLGRRAVVKAVWEIDAAFDRISSSFDFLMTVNPINTMSLWQAFRKSNYEKLPALRYKPVPIDISLAKRSLFNIEIERIEDPTLSHLFYEKQEELDRQLTMLKDRGTKRFVLGGIALYGGVSKSLIRVAEELFERVPGTARTSSGGRRLKPAEFVELAKAEIAHYKEQWPGVSATVRTSSNVLAGLMVSQGHLIVASDSRPARVRADALIQHEIGTHLVTYYNGMAQPLTQLRAGLAGYEELQEGLAVFAEYLVGGMTHTRLRTLAARVVASAALVDGATFVDTFRLLCRYGFPPRPAFNITLRIYRGGGLIKDCVYLRGLQSVLDYVQSGQPFERLFVGKIAAAHVPIIAELESRKVLRPPRLMPRYLERDTCKRRLAELGDKKRLYQLVERDDSE